MKKDTLLVLKQPLNMSISNKENITIKYIVRLCVHILYNPTKSKAGAELLFIFSFFSEQN